MREKSRNMSFNKYLSKLIGGCAVVTAKPKVVTSSPLLEMSPGIWSRLPPELLDHVLSFVPLKNYLNLRSTSKHFHSLLYSPSFISKHSHSSFSSFLLLSHPQCSRHLPLYDSALATWQTLPLPLSVLSSSLLSIANGLLCFSLRDSSSLLVCNLFTKSSTLIPLPYHPSALQMLTLVSLPLGYKIFTLFSTSSHLSASFLFDSRNQSWRRFNIFETSLQNHHHHHPRQDQPANYNGRLYFVTPETFSIVTFDLENGEWEESGMVMPEDVVFVRLVSDGDGKKLYMIGGIGRNGISRTIKVWEFSEERRKWVEVVSVPEMICNKLMSICYHNYKHVYCFWHQGTICVCCYTWPEILWFQFCGRSWHWLPICPSLPETWSCGFRWFSFVPQLYASP